MTEQRASLEIVGECNEVCFPEALASRGGTGGSLVCLVELARTQMSLRGRQQEVASLDAIPPFALDQTLRPAEPSIRAAGFSARNQAKPQPERGPCGGQTLARLEKHVIQALLRRQHRLIPRRQPSRPSQPVEILRAKRCRLIRERQRLEGVIPFVTLEAGTPPL